MTQDETIEIIVPSALVTSKSVAWGGKSPELHKSSMEAIRHAVQSSEHCMQLRDWLNARTKLQLNVLFCLSSRRVAQTDLDSLLSDLLNPLVEGACGPRPGGKPIPQTKDALFWHVVASKIKDDDEKIVISIRPINEPEV